MIPLDNIRISRRWSLRLTATSFPTQVLWRISRTAGTLPTLLGRILVRNTSLLSRELSTTRLLLRHSAVVHTALLARRPRVRNNIVSGALTAALVVRHWAVAVIRIGILEDDVPGVEKAGEEAETAEGDVDEGVGGADTALYPYYRSVSSCIGV